LEGRLDTSGDDKWLLPTWIGWRRGGGRRNEEHEGVVRIRARSGRTGRKCMIELDQGEEQMCG